MKVLLANWVYGWGSTGYILRDLVKGLKSKGVSVVTAAGTTKGLNAPDVYQFATPTELKWYHRFVRIGFPKFYGSPLATLRFKRLVMRENPDIVHLHLLHCSTLNFYRLLKWLSSNKIKTVITNHAEIYYTGGCEHAYNCEQWINSQCRNCPRIKQATGSYIFGNPHRNFVKISRALRSFDPSYVKFTAVSPWLKSRFEQSPISKGYNCETVINGVDTGIFNHRDECNLAGLTRNGYMLYVTARFNPNSDDDVKGSKWVAKIADNMPQSKFVIVSTESANIEGLPNNIVFWGKAKSQDELAELYSNAAVVLITSRRETFSMVTAESLCCGTPVVGFKAGGPESIALLEYSRFCAQGDLEALKKNIETISNLKNRDEISKSAIAKYSKSTMIQKYINVYKSFLSDI